MEKITSILTITVSGPQGCGKSAAAKRIITALTENAVKKPRILHIHTSDYEATERQLERAKDFDIAVIEEQS